MRIPIAVAALFMLLPVGAVAAHDSNIPVPGPRPDFTSSSTELRAYNSLLLVQGVGVDTVLCGDSMLVGIRLPDLWPGDYVVNRSIGGDDSANLRARFAKDVLVLKPKHVVVSVGANDFWWTPADGSMRDSKQVVAALAENIAAIHHQCRAAGAQLTVCSLLPVNFELEWGSWRAPWVPADAHAQANARLAAVCADRGIPYLDLYSLVVDKEGRFSTRFTADGVHPNVAADILIMHHIRTAIQKGRATGGS